MTRETEPNSIYISGPLTALSDIIIGALALLMALAAFVVAAIQLRRSKAIKPPADPESAQNSVELPRTTASSRGGPVSSSEAVSTTLGLDTSLSLL